MKHWTILEDGGSGRWLYSRPIGPMAWAFIAIDDAVECCGRDADCYFYGRVAVVDLLSADPDTIASALDFAGAETWLDDSAERYSPSGFPDNRHLAIAQCMFGSGAMAPVWDGASPPINKERNKDWNWNVPSDRSPTFLRLRAAARRFAESELLDDERREELLDTRIVNRLGQTAREYARGTSSLWDKLRAIAADPDATDAQRAVLQMYQGAEQTLGAGPVPSDIRQS